MEEYLLRLSAWYGLRILRGLLRFIFNEWFY